MARCSVVVILVLSLLAVACISKTTRAKTLVVLEDLSLRASHSQYLQALEKVFDVTYKLASDKDLSIATYGEYIYDNIVLFTPSIEGFGGKFEAEEIVKFIDAGHNVILAADSDLTDPVRTIASACGVDFDEQDTKVIDHLNFDDSDFSGDHSLLVVESALESKVIFGDKKINAPVLFRGIGQSVVQNSDLLSKLLRGSASSYSAKPGEVVKSAPHTAGTATTLVSLVQARNNARILISGSLELFSNEFFNAPVSRQGKRWEKSGNEVFAVESTMWTFQQRGLLRAENATHFRKGESSRPAYYRIKDEIEYHIDISEWNGNQWVPFQADDVQLEIVMLDPYIRSTLKHDKKGHFSTSVKLPDVYGVYTFKINYRRLGYSFTEISDVIPIRPFRHNEYERFIVAAYPYYAGAFSMLIGLVVFSFVFLWSKDPTPHQKTN